VSGVNSIYVWSENIQGVINTAQFQPVVFDAGSRGPAGSGFSLINGGDGLTTVVNTSVSAWCLLSYKIDVRSAGGGPDPVSSTTAGTTIMLNNVTVSGSSTLVQAPESNHIYTVANTLLLQIPENGTIKLLWWASDTNAKIGEPTSLKGKLPPTYAASPAETTASMVITRISDA